MQYIFRDTDIYGLAEYDICGNEYEVLIATCCKYSKTISLVITNLSNPIVEQLQQFRIMPPNNVTLSFPDYDRQIVDVAYYKVCSALCEILITAVDSIFQWIDGWGYTNPNDPTFYREDGSVFFSSTIHDGICILVPRIEEDVTKIIQNPQWQKKDICMF